MTDQPWSDRENAIYEVGYRDGESSTTEDWIFALNEHADLPEDVNLSPMEVAAYIDRLQREAEELRRSED